MKTIEEVKIEIAELHKKLEILETDFIDEGLSNEIIEKLNNKFMYSGKKFLTAKEVKELRIKYNINRYNMLKILDKLGLKNKPTYISGCQTKRIWTIK